MARPHQPCCPPQPLSQQPSLPRSPGATSLLSKTRRPQEPSLALPTALGLLHTPALTPVLHRAAHTLNPRRSWTHPPSRRSLCAGIYTFTLKDGTKVPARFSYLFVKRDGKW
jgi:hypothetical protein